MSEPSKALPSAWIAKLFSRFRTIYGNRVDITYGKADADELIAEWSERLAAFEGEDFRAALDACAFAYQEFPPTLFQFADLCKQARRRRVTLPYALPDRSNDVDAQVLAEIHRLATELGERKRDPRDWARKLLQRHANGEKLSPLQVRFAREALGINAEPIAA